MHSTGALKLRVRARPPSQIQSQATLLELKLKRGPRLELERQKEAPLLELERGVLRGPLLELDQGPLFNLERPETAAAAKRPGLAWPSATARALPGCLWRLGSCLTI